MTVLYTPTTAADYPPLPDGQYGVIMVDPPWMYTHATRTTETPGTGWRGQGERYYPTMRYEDIAVLDVPSVAATDCVLWLWVVNPLLAKGIDLAARWGFEYKGLLTWAKTCSDWRTPAVGTGYWLRGASEHMVLATRGRPRPQVVQPSWFAAPRGRHSRKPDEAYAIAARYSAGRRLELFARETRPGWTSWGNEVAPAKPTLFDGGEGQ